MKTILILAAVGALAVTDPSKPNVPAAANERRTIHASDSSRVAGLASRGATVTRKTWEQRGSLLSPIGGSASSPDDPAGPSTNDMSASTGAAEVIAAATRGVLGSKHDFSRLTGRPLDACAACHVPHVLAVRATTQRGGQTALAFYRLGGQREVLVPDRYTPGPASLICLSCHNGTVATSTIGSSHAMMAGVREGFDIPRAVASRDHPIGIEYPAGTKGFRPRAMVEAEGKIRLPEGRLECVSCHDPHNPAGIAKMLVKSNRRSALCLSCHVK